MENYFWETAHPKVFSTLMRPNTSPMGPLDVVTGKRRKFL